MQKTRRHRGDPEQMGGSCRAREKGETDDMDYKHNVYVYQTEWANRVAADYGSYSAHHRLHDEHGRARPCCCPQRHRRHAGGADAPLQKAWSRKAPRTS